MEGTPPLLVEILIPYRVGRRHSLQARTRFVGDSALYHLRGAVFGNPRHLEAEKNAVKVELLATRVYGTAPPPISSS